MYEEAISLVLGLSSYFVISLIFIYPCYCIARKKGHRGLGWIIMSCIPFINFITLMVAVAMPDLLLRELMRKRYMRDRMRECPVCAEYVSKEYRRCVFCGNNFDSETE